MSVILAVQGLTFADIDLSAQADDHDAVHDVADSPVSYGEARGRALAELERAERVLLAFGDSAWFEMEEYVKNLSAICRAYTETRHPRSATTLDSLAANLGLAFNRLEGNTDDIEMWRQLARASLPQEKYLPVPARFVAQSTAKLTAPKPWTEIDFEVWG